MSSIVSLAAAVRAEAQVPPPSTALAGMKTATYESRSSTRGISSRRRSVSTEQFARSLAREHRGQLRVLAMTRSEALPSSGALEEVRRLAGPSAVILGAPRLEGGQHANTWRVDTENPPTSVVVRQFPVDDPAPLHERRVLRALDGLDGLAPVLLGDDLNGQWSKYPTSLTSWLDGEPDITPTDPGGGRAS